MSKQVLPSGEWMAAVRVSMRAVGVAAGGVAVLYVLWRLSTGMPPTAEVRDGRHQLLVDTQVLGESSSPAQSGSDPLANWIHITKDQVPQAAVMNLKEREGLRLEMCREAVWESTGLDFIAESSFVVIVMAVVDGTGAIQRFRILHGPSTNVDMAGPVRSALAAWRFRVPEAVRSAKGFQVAIAIPKERWVRQSSACTRAKPEK